MRETPPDETPEPEQSAEPDPDDPVFEPLDTKEFLGSDVTDDSNRGDRLDLSDVSPPPSDDD
jgi:hypothetical protein